MVDSIEVLRVYEVNCLQSIFEALQEKGIRIPFKYFGPNDYASSWEIKAIIENKAWIHELITSTGLQDIVSLTDYLNYLYFRKLSAFKELIPHLVDDANKQIIGLISDSASLKLTEIKNGEIIRFINQSYEEAFSEKYRKFSLHEVTFELIISFQNGISHEVFKFLAKNYNYWLLDEYEHLQNRFESNPQLFDHVFREKNLQEIQALGFDRVFPVFVAIWNRGNESLKSIVAPIIESIINDTKSYIEKDALSNSRDIAIAEHTVRQVYEFLQKIKHPKANQFREYHRRIEKELVSDLEKNGQVFTFRIPAGKIIEYIKEQSNWQIRMLSLTHSVKKENNSIEYISRLDHPSKGKQGIIDFVSSNTPSDEYFTHSHQNYLGSIMAIGSATISAMWHDKELFPECIHWYSAVLSYINDQIGGTEDFDEDLEILYSMLQIVIMSDESGKEMLKPLCYGAAMFICASIEKLLRAVYIYLFKDQKFIPLTSATLGSMLAFNRPEMVDIWGEDHLKSLSYFLGTVGDKKVGLNIRNQLAHWTKMEKRRLNSMLVAELFYLYTDVINTLFWHFLKRC